MKRNQKINLALESVYFSSLSYGKGVFFNNELKRDEYKNDAWIWHFDKQAKILFLSIRGTDDMKDLLKDASIIPKHLKNVGYLHSGFLSSSRSVLAYCLPQINHAKQIGYKVVLSGHSYGGAIAQVMQQILRTQFQIDSECVSFGSPRVWMPYAKPKGLHLRVHIDSDPVTKMPFIFGWVFRIFKHKQTEILEIDTDDYFTFSNHKISTYEKLLEREFKKNAKPQL